MVAATFLAQADQRILLGELPERDVQPRPVRTDGE